MMLRYLLSSWVRQTAQQKIRDAVTEAADRRAQAGVGAPPDQGPAAAPPQASVVCVFALSAEVGGLADLLSECVTSRCSSFLEYAGYLDNRRVALIESGVGQAAAARATADAIALHRPRWVISAGFAGALLPQLRRGHILMADEVVDQKETSLTVGLQLDRQSVADSPSLHVGRLLTVDHLIRTTAEKKQLAERYGGLACDMESWAIAEVCRRESVRFLSVRIISDAFEDELPQEIERLMDQKSLASKLGAATGAIFHRPSSVKDMWKLKEQAIKASDRLARFIVGTIAQLPADDSTESS